VKKTLFLSCLATALLPVATAAQSFPDRPLRMIVPFAPGGVADIVARLVGQKMGENLGQNVVIDNRTGAGGSIAGDLITKARPDGYTFLLCTSSVAVFNPLLTPNAQFDPQRDLAPLSLVSSAPFVLLVPASSPANNVAELIALAKAKPGSLNFGSAGVGSASHLISELFVAATGIKATHVPYKGTAPATNDLLAGQIQMMMDSITASLPHIQSKRVRALGISTRKPFPLAPTIPTIAATVPGFEGTTWQGLCAPAGTPKPIIDTLSKAAITAVKSPEITERFAGLGVEGIGSTPDEFRAFHKAELAKWGKAIRDAGIKAQ